MSIGDPCKVIWLGVGVIKKVYSDAGKVKSDFQNICSLFSLFKLPIIVVQKSFMTCVTDQSFLK